MRSELGVRRLDCVRWLLVHGEEELILLGDAICVLRPMHRLHRDGPRSFVTFYYCTGIFCFTIFRVKITLVLVALSSTWCVVVCVI